MTIINLNTSIVPKNKEMEGKQVGLLSSKSRVCTVAKFIPEIPGMVDDVIKIVDNRKRVSL